AAIFSTAFIVVTASNSRVIRGQRIAELIDDERRGRGPCGRNSTGNRCIALLGCGVQRSLLMKMRKGLAEERIHRHFTCFSDEVSSRLNVGALEVREDLLRQRPHLHQRQLTDQPRRWSRHVLVDDERSLQVVQLSTAICRALQPEEHEVVPPQNAAVWTSK